MIRRRVTILVLVFGLIVASGCGAEDDETSGLAAFKACGGFLTGTRQVVDAEFDLEATLDAVNSSLPPSCKGSIKSATFDATGVTITYVHSTANTPGIALYDRTVEGGVSTTEQLVVSSACVAEQFGGGDCNGVAAAFRSAGAAQCNVGPAPCSCTVTVSESPPAVSTVVAEGVQFTTDEGEIYEFCQRGDTLEQAKRDSSGKLLTWLKLVKK